jgi:cell wall-associated NlpC family hydrolase
MRTAMPRRLPSLLACLLSAAALAPATASAATALGTWNPDDQHAVRAAQVMHNFSDERFHGEQHVAGRQLPDALAALAAQWGIPAVSAPASRVSVITFDRLLVTQMGAADVAAGVQAQARHAGLHPPAYFGTEVVARVLGLRDNHPAPHEELELFPTDAITRAEAAHSFAVALQDGPGAVQWTRDTFAQFVLPRYTAAQRHVLSLAVAKIGMPYIWGGETDTASSYFGGQEHGGYDCSGFVWRVFKLSGFSWGLQIHGRTAAQQAGEIRRGARIRMEDVQPGDLLVFGPGKFWQKATERRIVHEGIALGNGWLIHSSGQGVYVLPLSPDSWPGNEFVWARRVI